MCSFFKKIITHKNRKNLNEWEKFSEILLHEKVRFHSNLNMKDIGGDYAHAKRVCKQKSLKRIHYCKLMYLRTFKIGVLKYMNLPLLLFLLQ